MAIPGWTQGEVTDDPVRQVFPPAPKPKRRSMLVKKWRERYPGEYDDLDDDTLQAKILARYPGEYDDLAAQEDPGDGGVVPTLVKGAALAARVGLPIAGTVLGAAGGATAGSVVPGAGTAAGGLAGGIYGRMAFGAAGEALAQGIEKLGGVRESFSPSEVAIMGGVNALPLGPAARKLGQAGKALGTSAPIQALARAAGVPELATGVAKQIGTVAKPALTGTVGEIAGRTVGHAGTGAAIGAGQAAVSGWLGQAERFRAADPELGIVESLNMAFPTGEEGAALLSEGAKWGALFGGAIGGAMDTVLAVRAAKARSQQSPWIQSKPLSEAPAGYRRHTPAEADLRASQRALREQLGWEGTPAELYNTVADEFDASPTPALLGAESRIQKLAQTEANLANLATPADRAAAAARDESIRLKTNRPMTSGEAARQGWTADKGWPGAEPPPVEAPPAEAPPVAATIPSDVPIAYAGADLSNTALSAAYNAVAEKRGRDNVLRARAYWNEMVRRGMVEGAEPVPEPVQKRPAATFAAQQKEAEAARTAQPSSLQQILAGKSGRKLEIDVSAGAAPQISLEGGPIPARTRVDINAEFPDLPLLEGKPIGTKISDPYGEIVYTVERSGPEFSEVDARYVAGSVQRWLGKRVVPNAALTPQATAAPTQAPVQTAPPAPAQAPAPTATAIKGPPRVTTPEQMVGGPFKEGSMVAWGGPEDAIIAGRLPDPNNIRYRVVRSGPDYTQVDVGVRGAAGRFKYGDRIVLKTANLKPQQGGTLDSPVTPGNEAPATRVPSGSPDEIGSGRASGDEAGIDRLGTADLGPEPDRQRAFGLARKSGFTGADEDLAVAYDKKRAEAVAFLDDLEAKAEAQGIPLPFNEADALAYGLDAVGVYEGNPWWKGLVPEQPIPGQLLPPVPPPPAIPRVEAPAPDVPTAPAARGTMPSPTPDRRWTVGRGMNGNVEVVAPTAAEKLLFTYAARRTNSMQGQNPRPFPEAAQMRGEIAEQLGVDPDAVPGIASDYRRRVLELTKGLKEGDRVDAPAWNVEPSAPAAAPSKPSPLADLLAKTDVPEPVVPTRVTPEPPVKKMTEAPTTVDESIARKTAESTRTLPQVLDRISGYTVGTSKDGPTLSGEGGTFIVFVDQIGNINVRRRGYMTPANGPEATQARTALRDAAWDAGNAEILAKARTAPPEAPGATIAAQGPEGQPAPRSPQGAPVPPAAEGAKPPTAPPAFEPVRAAGGEALISHDPTWDTVNVTWTREFADANPQAKAAIKTAGWRYLSKVGWIRKLTEGENPQTVLAEAEALLGSVKTAAPPPAPVPPPETPFQPAEVSTRTSTGATFGELLKGQLGGRPIPRSKVTAKTPKELAALGGEPPPDAVRTAIARMSDEQKRNFVALQNARLAEQANPDSPSTGGSLSEAIAESILDEADEGALQRYYRLLSQAIEDRWQVQVGPGGPQRWPKGSLAERIGETGEADPFFGAPPKKGPDGSTLGFGPAYYAELLYRENPDMMRRLGYGILGSFFLSDKDSENGIFNRGALEGFVLGFAGGPALKMMRRSTAGQALKRKWEASGFNVPKPTIDVPERTARGLKIAQPAPLAATTRVEPVRLPPDYTKDMPRTRAWLNTSIEGAIPEFFPAIERVKQAQEAAIKALDEKARQTGVNLTSEEIFAIQKETAGDLPRELRRRAEVLKKQGQGRRAAYLVAAADDLLGLATATERFLRDQAGIKPYTVRRAVNFANGITYATLLNWGIDTAAQNLTQPILASADVPWKYIRRGFGELIKDAAANKGRGGASWESTNFLKMNKPTELQVEAGQLVPAISKNPRIQKAYEWLQKVDPSIFLASSDNWNRRGVFLGALEYATARGEPANVAREWALQVVRKSQGASGTRMNLTNPHWRGPILSLIRPFTRYPSIFLEVLADEAKKGGPGFLRLMSSMTALAALGGIMHIDMQQSITSGSRPLGIEPSRPAESAKRLFFGQGTPTIRGAIDLGKHVAPSVFGEPNHDFASFKDMDEFLASDLPSITPLVGGRYPVKVAKEVLALTRGEEADPARTSAGRVNPRTAGEAFVNLLGFKTTGQSEQAKGIRRMADELYSERTATKGEQARAKAEMLRAFDRGDSEAAIRRGIEAGMSEQQIKNIAQGRNVDRATTMFRNLSKKEKLKFLQRHPDWQKYRTREGLQ